VIFARQWISRLKTDFSRHRRRLAPAAWRGSFSAVLRRFTATNPKLPPKVPLKSIFKLLENLLPRYKFIALLTRPWK
jgi:hypothetical protein